MNDKPMKSLLVFDDREDTWLFRMAMENAESIDCDLVDVEHLDKSLRCSKENDFDLILLDLHRSSGHFLKTLARVRETAPGVPIVLPPENQNGFHPSGARREAAGSSRGLNGGNGDAVTRAMRYAVRRQQLQAELPRLALMDDLTPAYTIAGAS